MKKAGSLLLTLMIMAVGSGIIFFIPHNYHQPTSDIIKISLLPLHYSEQAIELTDSDDINAFCEPFFAVLSSINARYNPLENYNASKSSGIAYTAVIESVDGKTATYTVSTILGRLKLDKGPFMQISDEAFSQLEDLLSRYYYEAENQLDLFRKTAVTVTSGGETLVPLQSWSHGTRDNIAADALQIAARGIEDQLETLTYADDFKIDIQGEPLTVSYGVWSGNFDDYVGRAGIYPELVLPQEAGIYIVQVQVLWGVQGDTTAYDYVFKLDIH